jgi:hypothetical protein
MLRLDVGGRASQNGMVAARLMRAIVRECVMINAASKGFLEQHPGQQ